VGRILTIPVGGGKNAYIFEYDDVYTPQFFVILIKKYGYKLVLTLKVRDGPHPPK
jgi:hypothetical protein